MTPILKCPGIPQATSAIDFMQKMGVVVKSSQNTNYSVLLSVTPLSLKCVSGHSFCALSFLPNSSFPMNKRSAVT
jgi:hypothetical protein